jgi:hypothetical protein
MARKFTKAHREKIAAAARARHAARKSGKALDIETICNKLQASIDKLIARIEAQTMRIEGML